MLNFKIMRTHIKCNLEKDDLREYYDVEFYVQDQQEYDYEIDARSGAVLKAKKERD